MLVIAPLNLKHFTIANTNPPSLGECLTKTQLDEAPGERASDYVGRLEQKNTSQPLTLPE